ncbi:MAG: DUF1634 domain-containing protein [Methanomassiliicoccales archaeon]|nr:DUF1634 domain-containing protein [Methanomassiliicoccales archaeon]
MTSQVNLCHVVQPILRWGMISSLCMMLIGLAIGAVEGTEATGVLSLDRIPAGLAELDPLAFLTLGLVLLIATPLTRVVGALFVFLKEGDRKFILISVAVLLAVTAAVLLGAT